MLVLHDCDLWAGAAAGRGQGRRLGARGERGCQVPAVGAEQGAETQSARAGAERAQAGLPGDRRPGPLRAHGDWQGESYIEFSSFKCKSHLNSDEWLNNIGSVSVWNILLSDTFRQKFVSLKMVKNNWKCWLKGTKQCTSAIIKESGVSECGCLITVYYPYKNDCETQWAEAGAQ